MNWDQRRWQDEDGRWHYASDYQRRRSGILTMFVLALIAAMFAVAACPA